MTTRDIIWLRRMYYTKPQDIELKMEPEIVVEVYKPIESKDEEETQDCESKSNEGYVYCTGCKGTKP